MSRFDGFLYPMRKWVEKVRRGGLSWWHGEVHLATRDFTTVMHAGVGEIQDQSIQHEEGSQKSSFVYF